MVSVHFNNTQKKYNMKRDKTTYKTDSFFMSLTWKKQFTNSYSCLFVLQS